MNFTVAQKFHSLPFTQDKDIYPQNKICKMSLVTLFIIPETWQQIHVQQQMTAFKTKCRMEY